MDWAIRAEGLSKEYYRGGQDSASLLSERIGELLRNPRRAFQRARPDRFWALRDLNFEVHKGEVLGVIGRNGAGKSTLLKILSRITDPTQGHALVRGRLASLLEVGTGFHPELSGRENVYLNAAILGMQRKEVDRKFGDIVAFAGIERFLDMPVKRYSSGMYVRLAFAVAAHVDADVLVIDEVLAVGDATFQRRCLGKMNEVAASGRTVIFVSHNMGAVLQMCSRALVLSDGRCILDAPAPQAVGAYLAEHADGQSERTFDADPTKAARIRRIGIRSAADEKRRTLPHTEPIAIGIEYEVDRWPRGAYVCVDVLDERDNRIIWSCDATSVAEVAAERAPGRYRSVALIPGRCLAPGRHFVTVAIYAPGAATPHDVHERTVSVDVADGGTLLSAFGIRSHALTSIALVWTTERLN
jgi:lipopolysaccharide transport system ATP-binding protein